MGNIVEAGKFQPEQGVSRLIIYAQATERLTDTAYSVNKLLAMELLKLKPNRRTMQLEKCFVHVLTAFPEAPVIKDIDVMFNPAYEVDVMKVLTSAYKQKTFTLVWPGSYKDGRLIYSTEKYKDYKTFDTSLYDVICAI